MRTNFWSAIRLPRTAGISPDDDHGADKREWNTHRERQGEETMRIPDGSIHAVIKMVFMSPDHHRCWKVGSSSSRTTSSSSGSS